MKKTNVRPKRLRRLAAMLAGTFVLAASLLAATVPAGTATAASAVTPVGMMGDGNIPSDGDIAVGANDIVQVANSKIAVWSKTNLAKPRMEESIQKFQGPAASDNACGDPRIVYMPFNQRWAFSCTKDLRSPNAVEPDAGISLAVSKTSDPAGPWYNWVGRAATRMCFADQPKLMVTKDKLMLFTPSSGSIDTTCPAPPIPAGSSDEIFQVFPLASLLNGTITAPVVVDAKTSADHLAGIYQNAASVQADGYFVGNDCPGNPVSDCFDLLQVSGPPSSPTVTDTSIGGPTPTPLPSSFPPVPGGAIDQDFPSTDVLSAVMENRTNDGHQVIAFSGDQGCPSDPASYCVYRDVYDLNTGQLSTGVSGQPGVDNEIYGAIGIDAQGNLFDAYASDSPAEAPSAGAAGPDWHAEMAAATTATAESSERWGDYYAAAQDPVDGSKVWFVSDYQTTTDESSWNTAIGCGTATGYGCSQTPAVGAPQVRYQNFAPNPASTSIQPDITLNAPGGPVDLSKVTVRYWFTRDGTAAVDATCQFAQVGCSNVTESVVNLAQPVNGADSYLQVGFTPGAGQLAASGSTAVQLFLNKTDFSNFDQSNDYSYSPGTTPASTTAITVYVNGQLVWGLEP